MPRPRQYSVRKEPFDFLVTVNQHGDVEAIPVYEPGSEIHPDIDRCLRDFADDQCYEWLQEAEDIEQFVATFGAVI